MPLSTFFSCYFLSSSHFPSFSWLNFSRDLLALLSYRKLQVSGAIDLASKSPGASDSSNVKSKGEIDDPHQSDMKIRCLCGSSLETESMIKVIVQHVFHFLNISCTFLFLVVYFIISCFLHGSFCFCCISLLKV